MTTYLLDVNVVVAAHRDDHGHHALVRPWLDELVTGTDQLSVPALVCGSFLRLVTNRRIFDVPTPRTDAFAYLRALLGQPNHVTTGPGRRHLTLLERTCDDADASADLVPDAVLAAIALEHDCTVATLDRDFTRFTSVTHVRPGAGLSGAGGGS